MMHRCMGCMAEYSAELSACPYCNYQKNSKALQPYCLSPETVLDRKYIVGRVISEDAFAISYLAWDYENNQSVVIKEYFPKELSSRMPGQTEVSFYDGEKAKQYESGLMAFVEEANQLVRLTQNLEGVAKVYSLFVENSTAYTVNEHLETVSFKDIISMEGRLPWQDAVALMYPLIEAVDTMHKNNVISYGINPDKIVMTRDRTVKLLDFGGSRFETVGTNKNLSLITDEGFSAIELYRDDDVTAASDVYSIAATLYYAITGIVPDSAINRSSRDKLKAPSQLGVDISVNAENAIMNALNVNAAVRTASCGELLSQLYSEAPVERIVDTKKNDSGKWSKKAKIAVSVVAVIVIALIAGISVLMSSPKNAEDEKTPPLSDFSSMTVEQVEKQMKSYGYKVDIVQYEKAVENKEFAGKVVDQNPKAEESYYVKDEEKVLTLYIGKYVENIDSLRKTKAVMPDLIGKTEKQARDILEKAGFMEYSFSEAVYSDKIESGKVAVQSIDAGETITLGTAFTIALSKGEKPTTTEAPTAEKTEQAYKPGTTKAPTTKAPTTKVPTTKAPTTKAPTTKAPTPVVTPPTTTKAPTTKAPTTKAPTTKAPTDAPVTTASGGTLE